MAAYAALVSLVNNIEQITNHPCLSDSLNNKPIRPLLEKAGLLLDFIERYNHGRVTREAEDVERKIACAAHAAEDLIESHVVDQILPPSAHDHDREEAASSSFLLNLQSKITFMKWKVRHWMRRMGWLPADLLESLIMDQIHAAPIQTRTLDLPEIIEEMDAILKKANELQEREGSREEDHQPTHSNSTSRRDHQARETSMVGYEDERLQLMDELTNQQTNRHVISIVGMGGIGKTTLALNLYHQLLIKQYFDIRAWATVSQQSDAMEILSQLLSCLGKSSSESTVDELGEKLYKALSGRRYLIVLDDLWSVEAWDELRHFFPGNVNGSRVLLTTRLSNVARDCMYSSCLSMKPLDEDQCWQLLCENVFEQENCPYPELEQVGRWISGLCRGLPLTIVVIGGLLLKSPKTLTFWENVAFNMILGLDSKEKEEGLDTLVLSYNHLPPYLKPCFLYMGVFKEDSEIRASKIIRLWVAEGFLKQNNTQTLEEVGKACLEELIDRNLVMVSKHGKNGKIGSCRIHDQVRNLCLKVGGQQQLFYVNGCEARGTERRFIGDWACFPHTMPRLTRSMLAGAGGRKPADYKLLRVWDDGRIELDEDLDTNVNMRYLAYRRWFVLKLPSSVSLIWNLQTLIIKSHHTSAPVEIWKMRQLRHVKCSKLRLPPPPPPSSDDDLCMMDNLQTLTTSLNLRLSEEVCKLIPNINKLHLLFDNNIDDNNVGDSRGLIECLCNLDRLRKLESLKLSFRYKYYDYPKLHKKLRFPISLNKLSLSGCQLGCEDLQVIGWMPQLQVLDAEMHSDILEGWSPVVGQFPRLKFLSLHWFDLECWDADNSHFPVLEKLMLSKSSIEIPLGMSGIPTLDLIRLRFCDSSTAVSAVRIKEDQVENQGNDELQVQVLMSELDEEELNEMVEAEGLTLHSSIQLEIGEEDIYEDD